MRRGTFPGEVAGQRVESVAWIISARFVLGGATTS